MAAPETAATTIDDPSDKSAEVDRAQTDADDACAGASPSADARPGVLEGAFSVLEALGHADDGLGLTALARASGLAKTSAYRLAEQLVSLGAVKRVHQRYYVGALIARIGQRWQPDPLLGHTAQAPVHQLAVQARAVASLRVLHEDRLRTICSTMPHGHAYLPQPADSESTARTATGRVLYAAQPGADTALPECWTPREWRQLRESIHDLHATVVDSQEAFPGVCCISAPVWHPDGTCAGAVTAQLEATRPITGLRDLVVRAARRVDAGLW
ncbi:MAG TPA: helix-turn-helix domain-containing protein [Mycobacterium sp.]|nr:helix-turn-helix domain-containing protein [Mycobacterium sp.]